MDFKVNFRYQPDSPAFNIMRMIHPDTAFSLEFIPDSDYVWDGDCPAPDSDPYVVKFSASKIVGGMLIEGTSYLGGCYPLEDLELDFEVSGYADQQLEEAYNDLQNSIANVG